MSLTYSSSLTLSTAFQTITFADEDFDDAGAFSSTEFTAPTAGVYHFDCSVYDLSFSGVTPSASNYVELQMIPPAGITYIYSKSYLPNLATGYVPALNISQTLKLAAGNKVSFAIKKSFNNGSLILGSFSDSFSGYKVY